MSKVTTDTHNPTETTTDSPIKQALRQMDGIRETLKQVLRESVTVADTLKLAEKERKAGDREIEQFRDKLREIQNIEL
jgi:hypothetical protein